MSHLSRKAEADPPPDVQKCSINATRRSHEIRPSFGAEAIGDEFRGVHSCDGLAFDADGNATVTIPKSELNVRFFRPVISGGDE